MWKFADLYNTLQQFGIATPSNIHTPQTPPDSWFTAVHDSDYYHSFVLGCLDETAERRIGFNVETKKPELIERTRLGELIAGFAAGPACAPGLPSGGAGAALPHVGCRM